MKTFEYQSQWNITTKSLVVRVNFKARDAKQAAKIRRGDVESRVADFALARPSPERIAQIAESIMRMPGVHRVQVQSVDSEYSVIIEDTSPPDQNTLPSYLQDNAPHTKCNVCGRKSWADNQNFICSFVQPDGSICQGRMVEQEIRT